MQGALARLRARTRGDVDDGFTIVELMVALTLILTVMLALSYMLTSSLKQISFAKQRTTANGLLNQTMEQVRALQYSVVAKGLDDTDVTGASDSNITVSGSTYTFVPTGETIVHGSQGGVTQAPFIPHRTTTTLNKTVYTVSAYPTYFNGNTSIYRVTVLVSWTPSMVKGVSNQVSSQTVLYSPANGCLSDQTHPFSSPCQPFLYARATNGTGTVNIAPPSGASGNAIQGVALQQAELNAAHIDSTMQIEQVSRTQGSGQTSGAVLKTDSSSSSQGGTQASSGADTDPATQGASPGSASLSQSCTLSIPICSATASGPDANPDSITVVASDADVGSTASTAAAGASPVCADVGGVSQTNQLPCSSGSIQQTTSLSTQSASLGLFAGSTSLGTASLAALASPAAASKVFTSRMTSPFNGFCPSTTGDGCVHAGAQRTIGTVTLAGLPSALGTYPTNWGTGANNFLVRLSGYSDSVSAESGIGTSSPCAKQATTCAGTASGSLTYWNGNGYTTTTVNWGAAPPTISIPTVTATSTVGGQAVTVTITNTLTTGGVTTATSGTSPCRVTECQASAQVASPIQGDIVYTVTVAGATVANLDVAVNLGTLAVQTNYRAAPLAG